MAMKLGLIADIHANLPALRAVLRDMPSVDRLVCAGDIVGYNPFPGETVQKVRESIDIVVQGNHDRLVRSPQKMRGNRMAENGLAFAQTHLSDDHMDWLEELPHQSEIVDGDYLVVHSHPEKIDKYVFPDQFSDLKEFTAAYDGIILGHTHIQHKEIVDDTLIVNPGSVGQPRDGKSTAAYAVLDTQRRTADLRRAHYDVDRVYHEVVVNDLPTQTGERLFEGE